MIDVGNKEITHRKAIATGVIRVCPSTLEMIYKGESPKGNILAIAEVAGIMAAKNTANILPLCHPLLLDSVRIWFEIKEEKIHVFCEVNCSAKTGVEMEALVGVNACLLTIYDLAKAVDPVIEIQDIYLQKKEGGKSGIWLHPKVSQDSFEGRSTIHKSLTYQGFKVGVGTLSDRASKGLYEDKSGSVLRDFIHKVSASEIFYSVIPDEESALKDLVSRAVEQNVDLVLLTGGTGLSSRDITPDTLKVMATKELTGFGELQRHYGSQYTKSAWLSRASAYVVSKTLIVLFPGSPKAVIQGLECLEELIPHAIRMIRDEDHHSNKEIK